MHAIWEEIKDRVRSEIPEKSFSLWVSPLTLLEEREDALILACPNKFSRNWIMENYLNLFNQALGKMGIAGYRFELKIKPPDRERPPQSPLEDPRQLAFPYSPQRVRNLGRLLNREFTFDRFVVGKSNEFAYSVSRSIALGDGCPYDSLFVMANTGLGKSHLSQAIAHAVLEHYSKIRICYITAEDFVNEMIFSLKTNQIDEFKEKYRKNCDVLLLEEVHFLGGKQKTQIELGHTLDALMNSRKKIIFTSSLLPKDISGISREFSSRLTSGIITKIEKPDYATRVNILQKKSSEQNLKLSEEIIHLLAANLTRDVRQMESTLRCLKAKSELLKAKITPDLIKEEIKCHVSGRKTPVIDEIKRLVCRYFQVEPAVLESKSRKKIHAYPRNVYAYLCRRYTDETLENIGKSIDRNHSTVLYASDSIERKIKIDAKIKSQVHFLGERIEEMIK